MRLDAFLRLTNADDQLVEGESTDQTYAGQIEITDFTLCSGSDVEAMLGDVGGDLETQLAMKRFAMDNVKLMEQLKEQEERTRKKQEKAQQKQQHRAAAGFQSGLQQVTEHVAKKNEQEADKKKPAFGGDFMGFQIKKDVDAASADLFQAYCSTVIQPNPEEQYKKLGQFASAEVVLRKMFAGKARPYLFCSFHDLFIESYTVTFDDTRMALVETVAFKFVRYRMKYQTQTDTGAAGRASDVDGTVGKKQ